MRSIPLISAAYMARLTHALRALGSPCDRYLERAHISPRALEEASGFVPGRSAWAFADEADRAEGLGDLWLESLRGGRWRGSAWVRTLRHSATLGEAIAAMCTN